MIDVFEFAIYSEKIDLSHIFDIKECEVQSLNVYYI